MIQCLFCLVKNIFSIYVSIANNIHVDDFFCVAKTEAMILHSDQIGTIPTARGWVFSLWSHEN